MSENTTTAAELPQVELEPSPSAMLVNIISAMPEHLFEEAVANHQEILDAKAQEVARYAHLMYRYGKAGLDEEAYRIKMGTLLADYDQTLQAHADLVAARR